MITRLPQKRQKKENSKYSKNFFLFIKKLREFYEKYPNHKEFLIREKGIWVWEEENKDS